MAQPVAVSAASSVVGADDVQAQDIEDLEEGELDAELVSDRVVKATLPPDSMEKVEEELTMLYNKYGSLFSSREQCDYFHMLPLDKEARVSVMRRAWQLENEKCISK